MPPVTTREKLKKLFPTVESLEKARRSYKNWSQMASALGMHKPKKCAESDEKGPVSEDSGEGV